MPLSFSLPNLRCIKSRSLNVRISSFTFRFSLSFSSPQDAQVYPSTSLDRFHSLRSLPFLPTVLLGPVKKLSLPGVQGMQDRAYLARSSGLTSIANLVHTSAISPTTRATSPLACGLLRSLVLGTSREGYARACEALAGAKNPDWSKIKAEVLVVGGATDYLSTKEVIKEFCELIGNCRSVELSEVGHWLAIESPEKVAELVVGFYTK